MGNNRRLNISASPLMEVEHPIIGWRYHLAWAWSNGCVWVLKEIHDDGTVTMVTPKTGKILKAKRVDLRHTRGQQIRLQSKQK